MNKARRKRINEIISTLEGMMAEIEVLKEEEQEAFDAMPEGLQQSERGQQSESAIASLDNCDLSDIIASLEEARDVS